MNKLVDAIKGREKIILFSVPFIIYFQTLFFNYTYLDDNVLILDNLFFLRNMGNVTKIFTMEVFHILHSSAAYYRPLLTLSFMLDTVFAQGKPFVYHLSSVLVHGINVLLLYALLKKLKIRNDISFFVSLLFSIHPVLSQAVSWIPGRNDSLLFLFAVPSFIYFIDYLETNSAKMGFLSSIFFLLSLFTKESGAFVPILIVSFSVLFVGIKKTIKKVSFLFPFWFVTGVVWLILRSIALTDNSVKYPIADSLNAIVKNLPAIFLFLGKLLFPVNLSVLPTLVDSTLVYGIISLIILSSVSIYLVVKKQYKVVLFSWVFFVSFLVPSFVRPDTIYIPDFIEHRVYLPMIGILIILSCLIELIDKSRKYTYLYFLLPIIFLFSIINIIHTQNFKNKTIFWQNATKNSPSHPLAHKNLGAMYYLDGKLDDALPEFFKALELNPTESMVNNNIGLVYMQKRDFKKAGEYFQKELEMYPNYDKAYLNTGIMYYMEGKKDLAIEMFEKAIAINPDMVDAYRGLFTIYTENKDTAKANYISNLAKSKGLMW